MKEPVKVNKKNGKQNMKHLSKQCTENKDTQDTNLHV